MSYLSNQAQVQALQLAVQELVLKLADNEIVSVSGSDAVIKLGQPIKEIRAALFLDDSAATIAPVVAANRAVSGSQVTLTLSAPLAAADAIILEYVIQE